MQIFLKKFLLLYMPFICRYFSFLVVFLLKKEENFNLFLIKK